MRGRTSNRCYVCHKKGHFSKNCPDNRKTRTVIQALDQIELVDLSDIESIYSLDDERNELSLCSIAYTDDSDNDFESDEHSDIDVFGISTDRDHPVRHHALEMFQISSIPDLFMEHPDMKVFKAIPIPHIRSLIPVR